VQCSGAGFFFFFSLDFFVGNDMGSAILVLEFNIIHNIADFNKFCICHSWRNEIQRLCESVLGREETSSAHPSPEDWKHRSQARWARSYVNTGRQLTFQICVIQYR